MPDIHISAKILKLLALSRSQNWQSRLHRAPFLLWVPVHPIEPNFNVKLWSHALLFLKFSYKIDCHYDLYYMQYSQIHKKHASGTLSSLEKFAHTTFPSLDHIFHPHTPASDSRMLTQILHLPAFLRLSIILFIVIHFDFNGLESAIIQNEIIQMLENNIDKEKILNLPNLSQSAG